MVCPFGCVKPVLTADLNDTCDHKLIKAQCEAERLTAAGRPYPQDETRERNADGSVRRGRPTAAVSLSGARAARKAAPISSGLLRYFPNACAYVSHVSQVGNEQHNPGEPMHWAYDKSTDEADCIARHLAEAGTFDTDGLRHSGKVAWRAFASLERELLEADPALKPGLNVRNFSRGAK